MKRKDFPSYLEIDLNRLMRATGAQLDAEDLMEQAQLALRTGFTAEARDIHWPEAPGPPPCRPMTIGASMPRSM
ncbi:MAG: hypothetical protein EBY24_17915 [Betaproteobacteria bacterium]|nr:hypothetical protein [Betaproteobacteria bacterium]